MRYVYIGKLLRKKKGKGDFRMAQYGIRDITDLVLKARTRVKIGNQTFQPGQPVVPLLRLQRLKVLLRKFMLRVKCRLPFLATKR